VTIAILNGKGGVGKTTTSVNLAAALALRNSGGKATSRGRRVLLVDLDSQASASMWCGVPRERLMPSVASCLLQAYPALKAVRPTSTACMDLLTGSLDLASADLALSDRTGRELALREMLGNLRSRYENIVLDCPPGLSLLTINAILASDALIVPVVARQLVIDALAGWIAALDTVRARLGGGGRTLGLLLVMFEPRNPAQLARARKLRAHYQTFKTTIPSSPVCEDAAAACQTALAFAPRSPVARSFTRLAAEVLHRAHE
jgi:chromosome partitioning protein